MQRPTSRASDEDRHGRHHQVIDISHLSQAKTHSQGRMMEIRAAFTPSERTSGVGRRGTWRSRAREKWIHAIPLIVLLCFFILWWFSYSVNLKFKDGRIITVDRMEMTQPLNETRVDLVILATATPSNASVPQIQMLENEAEAQPVSPTD